MKQKWKLISLLTALLMLLPILAFAAEETKDEAASQPVSETTTSEESTVPVEDTSDSGSSNSEDSSDAGASGDSSSEPPVEGGDSDGDDSSSSDSGSTGSGEDSSSGDGTADEGDAPAGEGEGSSSDDELTGEEEGNTPDEGVDGESPEGSEGDQESSGDPDSSEDSDFSDDEEKKESGSSSSSKKSSGVSYAKARTAAIYEGKKVTVEELGTIHTQIKLDDELQYVLTSELEFPDLEDQPLQLAYIVAPKTGRASLRDKPAKGETIIRYGNAGDLAIVLEEGEDFTCILYRGTRCYAVTSTLQTFEIPEQNGEYAQLSYEEHTNGSTTINIRNQPDRSSCKIAEWRTGTEVTAWSYIDGWYEIEANGMRGFVMEEFITIAPGV